MQKVASIFIFILLLALESLAQGNFNATFKAKETVYLLRHGKFETVYARMDPVMKRMMDEDKLMGFWDGLEMGYGQVVSVDEPTVATKEKLILTISAIQFERKKVGLKIVFNEKAEISGLFLVSPTMQYQHPDYINPYSFYEYKKTLPDPKYPVEGVLTLPKKGNRIPLVIIVGELGATDKDFSSGANKTYKDLAWGLADNGVAVFRYDTRQFAYTKELNLQKNYTPKETYLADLQLAIKQLKKTPEIDSNQIIILGHGMGAFLLPYFQKNCPNIHGYISFMGQYSNLPELLIAQSQYLSNKLPEPNKQANKQLLQKAHYANAYLNTKSKTDSLPLGLPASYYLFLNENSPEKLAKELFQKRMLFIQGGRDYEVPTTEIEKWKAIGLNQTENTWTFAQFPKLNHLGMEGEAISLPSEYQKPGNVPLEVILKLVSFALY